MSAESISNKKKTIFSSASLFTIQDNNEISNIQKLRFKKSGTKIYAKILYIVT